MTTGERPIRWMVGTLQTPPVGVAARIEAGFLLRLIQRGESLGMPHARAMPAIGPRVHELRVNDWEKKLAWRIVYRADPDAILVVHWFDKKARRTPEGVIELCKRRLRDYDHG